MKKERLKYFLRAIIILSCYMAENSLSNDPSSSQVQGKAIAYNPYIFNELTILDDSYYRSEYFLYLMPTIPWTKINIRSLAQTMCQKSPTPNFCKVYTWSSLEMLDFIGPFTDEIKKESISTYSIVHGNASYEDKYQFMYTLKINSPISIGAIPEQTVKRKELTKGLQYMGGEKKLQVIRKRVIEFLQPMENNDRNIYAVKDYAAKICQGSNECYIYFFASQVMAKQVSLILRETKSDFIGDKKEKNLEYYRNILGKHKGAIYIDVDGLISYYSTETKF
jgi:hypothetical protein